MEEGKHQGQLVSLHWLSGTVYVIALLAGVGLIMSGRASVPEASGYVTPLLVIYERMSRGGGSGDRASAS
ncbi:hypothetical protein [Streptomyces kronopolitis]|uniref:hypothetical protein n=1 Tax=Streptomyces kronopolitis TaxID=1612435 RepID=UPI003D97EC66